MWDVDFQTAVSQAEVEDRDLTGAYHDIEFQIEDGDTFTISTTRPELLAACIAVVAHPDDKRYQHLFGKHAITPLFYHKVPILAAEHADPEKGTGILMVCTFGDIMDVEWWKQSALPVKQIIQRNGRLAEVDMTVAPFKSLKPELAQSNYQSLSGLHVKKARAEMASLLASETSSVDQTKPALVGSPKPTEHPVKFYEKGDTPLEFVPTRQWFIKILAHKTSLLNAGETIKWHPDFMKSRYSNWVNGLNQDWCISRQRFFGVPFPVWYPLDSQGAPRYDSPIFATPEELPIDPSSDVPKGYTEDQRNKANGFMADPDVMDTWATSSLTPQIATNWLGSDEFTDLFPMDLRPQSHEIIRTWAFYTIAKAWMHHQDIPLETCRY